MDFKLIPKGTPIKVHKDSHDLNWIGQNCIIIDNYSEEAKYRIKRFLTGGTYKVTGDQFDIVGESIMNSYLNFRGRKFEMTTDKSMLVEQIDANTKLNKDEATIITSILEDNFEMFLKHNISINIDGQKLICSNYFEEGALVEINNRESSIKAIIICNTNYPQEVKVRYLNTGYYDCIFKNNIKLIAKADSKIAKAAVAFMNEISGTY
jgi:hypothetical protein